MNDDHHPPVRPGRGRRLPQALLFVTVPGVLLGTVSITAAYSAGLMTPAQTSVACRPAVVPAPAPGSFTVNVMNATGRDGAAARVASGLAKRHFTVGGISNAPESWYVTQPAVIHHGPRGLDQALLVATQVPGATLFADSRTGTSVDVVVGLGHQTPEPASAEVEPASSTPGTADPVTTVTRPCS